MMKRVVFIAILAGLVLALVPGAYADTVTIGLQFNGSGPIIPVNAGPGGTAFGPASFGGWTISAVGLGTPPNPEPVLEGLTVDASAPGFLSSLQVYVSETDLTSPLGVNTFASGFTSNFILGAITSVTESTYVDTGNAVFGLGSLLSTNTFAGPIVSTQSITLNALTPSLPAPFSETEVFDIQATANGTTSDTITITTANAPEPGTLTLFGSGLVGLAGLLRRKLARA
jgi:PEP-CTERM motif